MSPPGDASSSSRPAGARAGAPFFWFAVVFLAAVVAAVVLGSVLGRPHAASPAPPASPVPPVTDAPRPGSGQGPSGLGPGGGGR